MHAIASSSLVCWSISMAFRAPAFTNYEFDEAPPPIPNILRDDEAKQPACLLGCPDPLTAWSDGQEFPWCPRGA
jgi:hypothetical protein